MLGVPLSNTSESMPEMPQQGWDGSQHGLESADVERYSRQIILPSFGVHSQAKLDRGSVLVIGAGGLGSPALLYLAAAGVKRIGIVDRDCVELSNIHRQIIHREETVGKQKTSSAKQTIHAINSSIHVEEFMQGFTRENALDIISDYDVVLDASDNAPTRYLISDACCVAKKPLVSGAAIGTDGQLTVYCYEDGPCYRCLYPTPPPATSCSRCADAGVLGPVPGAIGTMQAMEVIKILAGIGDVLSKRMLVMDALYCRYMVVKLRSRNQSCVSCGVSPSITRESLPLFDYFDFTGQPDASDAATEGLKLVDLEHRITVRQLKLKMEADPSHVLIDVRPRHQFDICSIPGSINIPMASFDVQQVRDVMDHEGQSISVVCRRGNQSQKALLQLHENGINHAKDVIGGVQSWSKDIDSSFPTY